MTGFPARATLTASRRVSSIRPMRHRSAALARIIASASLARACSALLASALVFHASTACAQRQVCAPPATGENVVGVCQPFALFPVVRFLADFSVDHHFKPAPPPFERSLLQLLQPFAAKELLDNDALRVFLAALAPLRFVQLDRSTGTVFADFAETARSFEGSLERSDGPVSVSLELPASLQGGYWRGPDLLQLAFWEKHRLRFRLGAAAGRSVEAEVECVSLSPDGLLLRFAPATTPPLLLFLRECPK